MLVYDIYIPPIYMHRSKSLLVLLLRNKKDSERLRENNHLPLTKKDQQSNEKHMNLLIFKSG